MKAWFAALCCAVLTACSTTAPPPFDVQPLFDDALFVAPSEPVSADGVFTLSPRMREVLERDIRPRLRSEDPRRVLISVLYAKSNLWIEYDAEITRTAAQAFDARAGNCLSLLIMMAAFAREAGVPVRFQSVSIEEAWARDNGLLFAIGHVNLALGRQTTQQRFDGTAADWLTVDFYTLPTSVRQRHEVLDESRVLAMYMNNRAAESLAAGQVDNAYWWARGALLQDRRFAGSYNTLAVVYQRRQQLAAAERALRAALTVEPAHVHAISNLAGLLQRQGRDAEAQLLNAQLRRLQPVVPFAAFDEGLKRLREGRVDEARKLFEKELGGSAGNHEVHFWLAVARLQLGDVEAARRHLKLAAESSITRAQQSMYAAKLERLKSQAVN